MDEYKQLTIASLRSMAKQRGLNVSVRSKKKEIIALLQAEDEASNSRADEYYDSYSGEEREEDSEGETSSSPKKDHSISEDEISTSSNVSHRRRSERLKKKAVQTSSDESSSEEASDSEEEEERSTRGTGHLRGPSLDNVQYTPKSKGVQSRLESEEKAKHKSKLFSPDYKSPVGDEEKKSPVVKEKGQRTPSSKEKEKKTLLGDEMGSPVKVQIPSGFGSTFSEREPVSKISIGRTPLQNDVTPQKETVTYKHRDTPMPQRDRSITQRGEQRVKVERAQESQINVFKAVVILFVMVSVIYPTVLYFLSN